MSNSNRTPAGKFVTLSGKRSTNPPALTVQRFGQDPGRPLFVLFAGIETVTIWARLSEDLFQRGANVSCHAFPVCNGTPDLLRGLPYGDLTDHAIDESDRAIRAHIAAGGAKDKIVIGGHSAGANAALECHGLTRASGLPPLAGLAMINPMFELRAAGWMRILPWLHRRWPMASRALGQLPLSLSIDNYRKLSWRSPVQEDHNLWETHWLYERYPLSAIFNMLDFGQFAARRLELTSAPVSVFEGENDLLLLPMSDAVWNAIPKKGIRRKFARCGYFLPLDSPAGELANSLMGLVRTD